MAIRLAVKGLGVAGIVFLTLCLIVIGFWDDHFPAPSTENSPFVAQDPIQRSDENASAPGQVAESLPRYLLSPRPVLPRALNSSPQENPASTVSQDDCRWGLVVTDEQQRACDEYNRTHPSRKNIGGPAYDIRKLEQKGKLIPLPRPRPT